MGRRASVEETTWDDADDDDDEAAAAAAAAAAVNARKESASAAAVCIDEILMMVVAARIRLLPRSPFGWVPLGSAQEVTRINRHSPRGDEVDSSHESPVP